MGIKEDIIFRPGGHTEKQTFHDVEDAMHSFMPVAQENRPISRRADSGQLKVRSILNLLL